MCIYINLRLKDKETHSGLTGEGSSPGSLLPFPHSAAEERRPAPSNRRPLPNGC